MAGEVDNGNWKSRIGSSRPESDQEMLLGITRREVGKALEYERSDGVAKRSAPKGKKGRCWKVEVGRRVSWLVDGEVESDVGDDRDDR